MPEERSGPYGATPAHGNVFVGSLQPHVGQAELMEAFTPYGEITSTRVMTGPDGNSKGSAFVEFMNPADAAKAIAGLSGHEGWVVKLANNSREKGGSKGAGKGKAGGDSSKSANLFIRGLPSPEVEKDALCQLFEDLGHHVVRSRIMADTGGRGSSAAMVELASADQAEDSINKLSGTSPASMPDCTLDVQFAAVKGQGAATPAATGPPSDGAPLTVKYAGADPSIPSNNLYINGLPSPPPSTEDLNKVFEALGYSVTRSRVIPDTGGRGNSAAMVQLESQEQAAGAIETLHGEMWPSDVAPSKPAAGLTVKFAGADPSVPSANLYIKGLPSPAPSQESLNAVFSGLGYTVMRSKVIPDTGNKGNSAAMVQLASQEEAEGAIAMLNGEVWPDDGEAPAAPSAPPAIKAIKKTYTNGHSAPMATNVDTSEALSEALPRLASAVGRKWTELAAMATKLEEKHWMSTMADLQGLDSQQWARLDLPLKVECILRSQLEG